ncbi:Uncharacterized protein dnm_047000 [Desulfonema magnum]|uniref:Uncharacterized protein n=1 Tax=Desulfonema magnum TaxID=45655 RepID=A0A975BNW5_9BACT|nr:Uncharacterized protein dnm_047000 [Desulfonema magnum]
MQARPQCFTGSLAKHPSDGIANPVRQNARGLVRGDRFAEFTNPI